MQISDISKKVEEGGVIYDVVTLGVFYTSRLWFLNGRLHRENGPAVEHADGKRAWCINGIELTEEEFNNKNNPLVIEDKIKQLLKED